MTKHMAEELKPVRCGCGGEAKVEYWVGRWYVRCQNANCLISTRNCDTEAETVTAWNRAMGADVNSVVSVFSSEVKDE